ncbi:GNAT family N-acetyltransferase [Rhodobacteraceae bacterium SC52]|nr:GNAT family N-acetyltransferase [Rhodobacteraceae bacterium SC52]
MQQHPAYALACAALGRRTRWVTLGPPHAPLASALVLSRRWPVFGRAALVSRGPVWHSNLSSQDRRTALLLLLEHLRKDHSFVIMTPDPVAGGDPLEGTDLLPMVTPMTLARLCLSGTPADRRASLHGKWRNRLVRAEAGGLDVTASPLPADTTHWLLQEEAAQSRERRYRRLPPSFAAAWAAASPGTATVFTARIGTDRIAGMLFLRHGSCASYHVGWSNDTARAKNAHNLLMWHAMEYHARQGVTSMDLDLIDTESQPGLARFKLGTGAKPVQLGATRISAPGTRLMGTLSMGLEDSRFRHLLRH